MNRNHPVKLAPSVLTANFGNLAAEIEAAEAGGADIIHLDVMDGAFVPNITFGPKFVETVRRYTSLPIDVHLMVQDPDRYLDEFIQAGADVLTVHVEASLHLNLTVQRIHDLGCRSGVAMNPATSVESVREILPFVNMILVMSVNPGFGSQQFIETSTSKIARTRQLMDQFNPTCDLQVDGGVYARNIDDVVRAGANVIVVGSAVFNDRGSVADNIAKLRASYGP